MTLQGHTANLFAALERRTYDESLSWVRRSDNEYFASCPPATYCFTHGYDQRDGDWYILTATVVGFHKDDPTAHINFNVEREDLAKFWEYVSVGPQVKAALRATNALENL
jgi:hypothetical protein